MQLEWFFDKIRYSHAQLATGYYIILDEVESCMGQVHISIHKVDLCLLYLNAYNSRELLPLYT